MKAAHSKHFRVLAIDPTCRGFGFALIEQGASAELIDWGLKAVRHDKRTGCLRKVRGLIDFYHPSVVVLEDCAARGSRRCPRVRRLVQAIGALAGKAGVKVRFVSQNRVRRAFAPASTKHEIAIVVARRFPELASMLPSVRRAWMSEDQRMNVFDAAAFALGFLQSQRVRQQSNACEQPLENAATQARAVQSSQ